MTGGVRTISARGTAGEIAEEVCAPVEGEPPEFPRLCSVGVPPVEEPPFDERPVDEAAVW